MKNFIFISWILLTVQSAFALRFYSPEYGRWLNRDPISVNGGINIYNSVSNNIVNGYSGGLSHSGGMEPLIGNLAENYFLDRYGDATKFKWTPNGEKFVFNNPATVEIVYSPRFTSTKKEKACVLGELEFTTDILYQDDGSGKGVEFAKKGIEGVWNKDSKTNQSYTLVEMKKDGKSTYGIVMMKFRANIVKYTNQKVNGWDFINVENMQFNRKIDGGAAGHTSAEVFSRSLNAAGKIVPGVTSLQTMLPSSRTRKLFDTIRGGGTTPATTDHFMMVHSGDMTKNLIAHEYGHFLGLVDLDNGDSIMNSEKATYGNLHFKHVTMGALFAGGSKSFAKIFKFPKTVNGYSINWPTLSLINELQLNGKTIKQTNLN